MTSLVSASQVVTGQVQSLDSVRSHALPSDAMIFASGTKVQPANQNPGSYAIVESAGATALTNNVVAAVTQSPFADLYKEGSMYFPGSTNSNIFCTTGSYAIGSGLTAECWLYPTSFTGSVVNVGGSPTNILMPVAIGAMGPSSTATAWSLGTNTTGNVVFYYYSSSSQSVTSITQLSANTWNHITATVSGGNIFLFINGVQTQVGANRNGALQGANFYETVQGTPGAYAYAGVGATGTAYTTGYIADARIISGAAVYTGSTSSYATFTVPSAPLSLAASGTTQFLLRAGQNSPTIQSGALTFDRGLKQYMNFGPQTFNIVTQGFTAVWRGQFTRAATGYDRLFEFGSGVFAVSSSGGNILVYRNGAGSTALGFYIQASTSTSNYGVTSTSGVATVGTTAVVAFRYNPVTQIADIWVNGVPNNSASVTTAQIVADRLTNFGYVAQSSYSGDPFASMTSNTLAIYNRALSNVEILNAYSALTTATTNAPIEIGDVNGTPALSIAGDGRVNVTKLGQTSNVVQWPPAAMTGYVTSLNGGTYVASASTEYSSTSGPAWMGFDKSATGSTYWSSIGSQYSASAPYQYTGSITTTDVNGTVYPGEWLQIQLPVPVLLSSYNMACLGTGYGAGKFNILGSRDGVNWFLVDSRSGVTWTNSVYQTFSVAATQAYNFYRFVASQDSGNPAGNNTAVQEWTLYGTADTAQTLTVAQPVTLSYGAQTASLTGISGDKYVPQDFSSSGLNVPAYVVSNTATVANTVQYSSFGPFAGEGSLYFQGGTSAYVTFPSTAMTLWPGGLTSFTDGTIEMWVYLTRYNTQPMNLIGRGVSNGTLGWFLNINSSGVLVFNTYGGGFSTSGGTVATNTWNHVAVSSKSNYISIFLNGTLVGTPFTYSGTLTGASTDSVFINTPVPANTQYALYAYISNMRIVAGQALYTTTFTPPTGPLQPIQGVTQAGTPYGTVLLLRNAPAPGRILTQKFGGANSGSVLSFPPAAMTTYATTLNSGYGQGTYVASASSENSTYISWGAFDKSNSGLWLSTGSKYNTSSPYNALAAAATTVDVNRISYLGEWLQIGMPSSVILSNYTLRSDQSTNFCGIWYIFGSRDGINWFLVDQETQASTTGATNYSYTVTSSHAFTWYRIVISAVSGYYSTAPGTIGIVEWTLNGTIEGPSVSADGRLGLGVSNPVQALEVAGSAVVTGTVSAGNPLMFRNRIINGDMRIDQRNAGASFTVIAGGTLTYTLDRWWGWCALGSKFSVQQSSVVPTGQGFVNSVLVTSLSAYSTPTGGYYGFGQYIEGYNIADMASGNPWSSPMSLSFWARSSIAGTFSVALENGSFNRSIVFNYTLGTVNTWQYFSYSFQADTAGSWDITSGRGLRIWFDLGSSDTTYAGAAGVWAAADKLRTTGAVSLIGTNAATLYITGVQLEKGSVATPYEVRPYATELALCQRYFEKSYSIATAPGTATESGNWAYYLPIAVGSTANWIQSGPVLQVSMRSAPAIVLYNSAGNVTTAWNALDGSTATAWRYLNNTSGGSLGPAFLGYGWTASAEL